jgi:glycosidase
MAENTPHHYRSLMLYQVYVRNYSEAGNFKAVEADLKRIKNLGTDVLYLLPIHPIGVKNRKGTLGSPYSIKDYRAVNEELGTMEDFKELIQSTHAEGMKMMMDIVFNHTSYDSWLFENHKEWFYQNAKGEYTNKVADWWDITDLDYTDEKLHDYLIDTLVMYTQMGVDGFRFDVANVLPLAFLKKARNAVLAVDPDSVWLSETTHGGFTKYFRDQGFNAHSEGEIFQVFDMAYDYDYHPFYEGYLKGEKPLQSVVDFLNLQDEIYPGNYVKLRNLENHDFGRIAGHVKGDKTLLKAWHAFSFMQKGATMIYMGGEFSDPKHPDLFNKDVIDRTGDDLSEWIVKLKKITENKVFYEGAVKYQKDDLHDVVSISYQKGNETLLGVFNLAKSSGSMSVNIEDGTYQDQLSSNAIEVKNGKVLIPTSAFIIQSH